MSAGVGELLEAVRELKKLAKKNAKRARKEAERSKADPAQSDEKEKDKKECRCPQCTDRALILSTALAVVAWWKSKDKPDSYELSMGATALLLVADGRSPLARLFVAKEVQEMTGSAKPLGELLELSMREAEAAKKDPGLALRRAREAASRNRAATGKAEPEGAPMPTQTDAAVQPHASDPTSSPAPVQTDAAAPVSVPEQTEAQAQ